MLQNGSRELLAQQSLFAGCDPVALDAVLYLNTRMAFAPGEPLFWTGEPSRGAYLIVSGTAQQVTAEGQATGVRFGPGSLLSEVAMFTETEHQSSVIAETALEVVHLSRHRMREILSRDPALAEHLAGRLQFRLSGVADQLRSVDAILTKLETTAIGEEDRTPPEQERDRTAAPSPAPRPLPALNGTPTPVPASPIHGPAVAHGSNGANPVHGSSTR